MLLRREIERVESRVLAAMRFVDASTGVPVEGVLRVTADAGVELIRNRSGLVVVRRHPSLAEHADAYFEAPADPAIGSVDVALAVADPTGKYLPRAVVLNLPRDANPANAANAGSIFRPLDVAMYRSPAAPHGANWATLRVSLSDTDSGDALGGALLRVVRNGAVLARGLTDWRGEALVPVVGIDVMTWSEDDDAVIATGLDATLEAMFNDVHGSARTSAADVRSGKPPAALPAPDPDEIETDPDTQTTTAPVHLVAGMPLTLALQLDLPA